MKSTIFLSESFLSVQGEGRFAGVPTYFVRVAGCNRRCSYKGRIMCDTAYALDSGSEIKIDEIVSDFTQSTAFKESRVTHVCITGGEPLMPKHRESVAALLKELPPVSAEIECNGDFPPLEDKELRWVHYNVSPKVSYKFGGPPPKIETLSKFLNVFSDFKFVVDNVEDLEKVVNCVSALRIPNERVFLMPFSRGRREYLKNLKKVYFMCLTTGFRLSPRLHIEMFGKRRGV